MIMDRLGIGLMPGNSGKDCAGNGEQIGKDGNGIECCCDECDYMLCCQETHGEEECVRCRDTACPRAPKSCGHSLRRREPIRDYQSAFYELFECVTKVLEDLHRAQIESFKTSFERIGEEERK